MEAPQDRKGELLGDALLRHAAAETIAKRYPSEENKETVDYESRFLWALTPALLRKPVDVEASMPDDTMHTSFTIKAVVRKRLQLAELALWREFFLGY